MPVALNVMSAVVCGAVTVTWMLAVCPPAVALMVAVPVLLPAVSAPVPITLAMELSVLVQVTFRSVASLGLMVAVSCVDSPAFRASLPSFTPSPEIVTEVTATGQVTAASEVALVAPSHFTVPPL